MKIYISGPMSNKPSYNYPAFNQLAETLRANGHKVYNPAEITGPRHIETMSKREIWVWYMNKAIILLMKADVIVLLPHWKESKGACLERLIAKALDYRIIEEKDLVDLGVVF